MVIIMKKSFLCLIVMLCTLLCGCSSQKPESLVPGKYQLEDTGRVIAPYVLLENGFVFHYSNFSSYINYGSYKIEDNTLILTTEDKEYTYAFQIDDGNLYFDLDSSSKLTEYKGEPSIEDGAKFVLVKDE